MVNPMQDPNWSILSVRRTSLVSWRNKTKLDDLQVQKTRRTNLYTSSTLLFLKLQTVYRILEELPDKSRLQVCLSVRFINPACVKSPEAGSVQGLLVLEVFKFLVVPNFGSMSPRS